MKRNEKILALALLCIPIVYYGWDVFDGLFLAPTRQARARLERVEQTVGDKKYELVDLKTAKNQLEHWSRTTLPPDPTTGQRLYMQWLDDIARLSGLNMAVEDGRRARRSTYTSVQVTLSGDGTFQELKRFLDLFRRADLLHHIVSMDIGPSPNAEGNPVIPLKIIAEGLCVHEAPGRTMLFPRAKLPGDIAASDTTLSALGDAIDARVGDRIRVDEELIEIVGSGEKAWTVQRGVNGTDPTAHQAQVLAELYPTRRNVESLAKLAKMRSPFVKPHDYQPEFEGIDGLRLVRGEPLEATIAVADFDPLLGKPAIAFNGGPDGMTFEPLTGNLDWSPADDVPAGSYEFHLKARLPDGKVLLEKTVSIALAEPNTPPEFPSTKARTAFHGDTFEWDLSADDLETPTELRYALEGAPSGATINPSTGMLSWTVPESVTPGEVTFTAKVTDTGKPTLSGSRKLTVKVVENLKPYVFLVGITREGADWEAWLWDRTEGSRITLRKGKSFSTVGMTGRVEKVVDNGVVLNWNGQLWRMDLGQHLGELTEVPTEPVHALRPPVEAPRPDRTVIVDRQSAADADVVSPEG